jgi:hypothetical protein
MLTTAMPTRKRIILVALGVILLIASALVIDFMAGKPAPGRPLPNPNGYDDFLRAGTKLSGDMNNAPTLNQEDLRALITNNSETLRQLRLGLTRTCSVPTDSAITNISGMLNDLMAAKNLALLLKLEGRLAELEGRNADAARSYADAIHLGSEVSRGGFIINRLVGLACEAIGTVPLSKLLPQLKGEETRGLAAALEKIDREGVTWDEVMQGEKRFAYAQLRQGFHPISFAQELWGGRQSRQKAELKHKAMSGRIRLLATELALRSYQAEQGRPPTSLEQLVPQYLQRVPDDPFRAGPVVYQLQKTNWLLYSVGEDGVDDGGKPSIRPTQGTVRKGDLFYDSPY